MNTRPALRPTHRLMASAVLCALLLTQALGLMHRVLHVHGPKAIAHADLASGSEAAQSHELEGLFSQHRDAQDCQLFDQLTQADANAFAVQANTLQPMLAPQSAGCTAPDLAAQAAGYLARGPPTLA